MFEGSIPQAFATDDRPVSLGSKFRVESDCTVSGARFFRPEAMTGWNDVALWSSGGEMLASGMDDSSGSGWMDVPFEEPVELRAGNEYTVSYFTEDYYSVQDNYFSPATITPSDILTPINGVFEYGERHTWPTNTYMNSCYFVDVILSGNKFTADTRTTVSIDDDGRLIVTTVFEAKDSERIGKL